MSESIIPLKRCRIVSFHPQISALMRYVFRVGRARHERISIIPQASGRVLVIPAHGDSGMYYTCVRNEQGMSLSLPSRVTRTGYHTPPTSNESKEHVWNDCFKYYHSLRSAIKTSTCGLFIHPCSFLPLLLLPPSPCYEAN